jgi:hypothetical protein
MRFIMMVKSDSKSEAGALPDEQLMTKMALFNEEMARAGVMKGGEGLQPSSKGVRVRLADKKTTVVDGPFAEARELVGGFWMVETRSLEEAIAWAKRTPFEGGEVEIRQVYEMSDFPADPTETAEGWREQERRFREAPPPEATVPGAAARLPGTSRFMMMLRADRTTESGALPTPEALTQMGTLMDGLAKTGALLAGEGLKPSAKGARVRFAGEKRTVIDGPFTETKEMIAGYSIVQVKSKKEAVELAKQWLQVHVATSAVPLDESEIEVRQLTEMEDFPASPDEKPDGWREREKQLRERLGT